MNIQPVIYAIVVTYNPEIDLLRRQYLSLINQVDGIIYVDNGSDVIYSDFFESEPKVHVIINIKNLGLGKAQNQGIQKSKALRATHILLMDQDSIVSASLVKELLAAELKLKALGMQVGAIGPAVHDALSNPVKVMDVFKFRGFSFRIVKQDRDIVEVSYIIASGSLISIQTFEEVGMLNEKLFIDSLDLEWCFRAQSKGFKIFVEPQSVMLHQLGNGNANKILSHSPTREYYICRNSFLLVRMKHIPLGYRLRKIILTPLRVLSSFAKGYKDHYKQGFKGIIDGFKG